MKNITHKQHQQPELTEQELLTEEEMRSVQGGVYVVGVGENGSPGLYRVQGQQVPVGSLGGTVGDALVQVVSNPQVIFGE
jgi:hypothetical protein